MRPYQRFLYAFGALALLIWVGTNATHAQWSYPRVWPVYPGPDPEATRAHIQAIIDMARDGDVINFNPGIYDFSAAPAQYHFQNGGALQIIDKSLIIKGAPGSILKGAPVIIEPDTGWMYGIKCFWISNLDANKSVTFDGLTFQTFMSGIMALHTNDDPVNAVYYANLKNLVVKNCRFLDIKRNGVACAGVQGNITISNNRINGDRASSRMGIYLDWLYQPGKLEWQPDNALITIANNSIDGFGYSGILTNRSSRVQITSNKISNSNFGILFNVGHKNGGIVSNNIMSDLDNEGILVQGFTLLVNDVLFSSVAQGLKLTYNNLFNMKYWGISISGDVAHSNYVSDNKINMLSGLALYSDSHDNLYANNTVRGTGFQAVYLASLGSWTPGVPDWGAHNERFFGNSFSGFAPQDPNSPGTLGWHYELTGSTYENIVVGIRTEHATYVDSGTNNILRFVYPYVPETVTTSRISLASSKTPNKPYNGAATI